MIPLPLRQRPIVPDWNVDTYLMQPERAVLEVYPQLSSQQVLYCSWMLGMGVYAAEYLKNYGRRHK